jgi:hypothetical protein
MLEFTHNNHLKVGYDGQIFNVRKSKEDDFQVTYGRATRQPQNFLEECYTALRLIREKHGEKLWLFYSGGSDSEFVLRCLRNLKIPFEVAILKFAHGMNAHDIHYALEFCSQNKIEPKIFELDVEEFFESGDAFKYAKASACASPILLPHLWGIEQIDGYPIISTGDCSLVKKEKRNPLSDWENLDEELFFTWMRYLNHENRPGCPHFFQYTPELIYANFTDPMVTALVQNQIPNARSFTDVKLGFYQKFLPMQQTPVPGYNGFERLLEVFAEYFYDLVIAYGTQVVKRPYSEIIDQLKPLPETKSTATSPFAP